MKFKSQTATVLTFIAIMLIVLPFAPLLIGIISMEFAIGLCIAHYFKLIKPTRYKGKSVRW